jgi:hypothetical protein
MKWAGSSLIKFLSGGVSALLSHLSETKAEDDETPAHDIDLYLSKESKQLGKRFVTKAWDFEEVSKGAVDQILLTPRAGNNSVPLLIDQVNLFKSTFLRGTDLWGNICVSTNETDMLNFCVSNMHPDSGVPLEISVHNALRLGGEDVTVPCYVLRRELMPRFDEAGNFIADESYCDGRFRGKLYKHQAAGLISLMPLWIPGPTVSRPETFVLGEDEEEPMDVEEIESLMEFNENAPVGDVYGHEPVWYDASKFDEGGC